MTLHIIKPEIDPHTIALGVKALLNRSGMSSQEFGAFIHELAQDVHAVLEAVEYPHLQRKLELSQRVADEALSQNVRLQHEIWKLKHEPTTSD